MATITCSNEQLQLIQKALDFYSRMGILQFQQLLEHPTIDKALHRQFSSKEPLKIGSKTVRGEVVKITKKAIWTKGSWGKGEEIKKWTDIENVKHSPDWGLLHERENEVNLLLAQVKTLLSGEDFGTHGFWGIYNPKVDESCRESFEIIQKIRHQFWLANPDRSSATVDAYDGKSDVKVEIDKN